MFIEEHSSSQELDSSIETSLLPRPPASNNNITLPLPLLIPFDQRNLTTVGETNNLISHQLSDQQSRSSFNTDNDDEGGGGEASTTMTNTEGGSLNLSRQHCEGSDYSWPNEALDPVQRTDAVELVEEIEPATDSAKSNTGKSVTSSIISGNRCYKRIAIRYIMFSCAVA